MFFKKEIAEKRKSALEQEQELGKPKKKVKETKEKRKVKRTTLDTLPYIKMCPNDILMVEKNKYSKTYKFTDVNYSTMQDEEQKKIFLNYAKLLNFFNPNMDVQISIINTLLDIGEFNNQILYKEVEGDRVNNLLKQEYNDMLTNMMISKKSKITREKRLALTLEGKDFAAVNNEFQNLEFTLKKLFRVNGSTLDVESNFEKIKTLKNIFRGIETPLPDFNQKDLNVQREKNFIAPDYFVFRPKYFMFNETFSQSLILRNLPNFLGDNLITQISELECTLNISVNINSVQPDLAIKSVSKKITSIESEKIKHVKQAVKNKVPADILPRDLQYSLDEAQNLFESLRRNDEKMFLCSVVVTIFSSSLEELKILVNQVKNIASINMCTFGELFLMQEEAMITTLPLGVNKLKEKRYQRHLTTNSTAIFMPFNAQSLRVKDGIFYGTQPNSNEPIQGNRKNLMNPNGFILGTSGSGKSVSAKDEMTQVFWKYPDDDVIIIDPQGEYVSMARAYGGETLKFSPTEINRINPLDISESYIKENINSPYALKTDLMISFIELASSGSQIKGEEKSIIDRCLNYLYETARERNFVPTLKHLYQILKSHKEYRRLAAILELFAMGSMDIFAYKTNININNRFFVYDITDLSATLKPIAMLIMLENIMHRITDNKAKGKFTWIFIDEMHLLLKYKQTAVFLEELFKIARKWNGIITGITQNITDLVNSEEGEKMLTNAEYVRLLKQKSIDKKKVSALLDISESQQEYIDNPERGCGLIVWNKIVIPFLTKVPEKSNLLRLWGTSQSDSI